MSRVSSKTKVVGPNGSVVPATAESPRHRRL